MLHDSARPCTAAHTRETLWELKFELLNPIYSLDLAPLDFHLFGPLEGAIRGCQLADYSEMKEALCDCLHTQPKQFF